MSKRGVEESGAGTVGQPPIKKVQFEPHLIGPVSTLEELDIKVLQFQNKKLAQVCFWNRSGHPEIERGTPWTDCNLRTFLFVDSVSSSASAARPNSDSASNSWKSDRLRTTLF